MVINETNEQDNEGNYISDKNRELLTDQFDNFKLRRIFFEELETGEITTTVVPLEMINIDHNALANGS